MNFKDYIFSVVTFFCLLLSQIEELQRTLIFIFVFNLLFLVLSKLGKGIVLRELMALYMSFICLFMPLIGYMVYTDQHPLSLLWLRYMNYPESEFFGFCLPAVAGYSLFLCWPMLDSKRASDQGEFLKNKIVQSEKILAGIPKTGIILMTVGVAFFAASDFLPTGIKFAFLLFFFASFAGLLYVYFQPKFKRKSLILLLFAGFIIGQSLISGMFTIVAYMGITLFSFLFIGKQIRFWKKFVVFLVAICMLFLIQSVKMSYRKYIWYGNYEGNSFSLFGRLVKEQVNNFSDQDLSTVFFPIYYRANQGFNVSLVMNRFPKYRDFDKGAALSVALASSFVPRAFWPDKPEAGGRSNMLYFTGFVIEGWSTNVGPIGEAYGSFGKNGGIIYMMVLGIFIRWAYRRVFLISNKLPLLLFWIPVIFYQVTYAAEADTLQIINSMIKSSFFILILYKVWPRWFGITKTVFDREKRLKLVQKFNDSRVVNYD